MQRENREINIAIEQITNYIGNKRNVKLKSLIFSLFLKQTNGDIINYNEVYREVQKIMEFETDEMELVFEPYQDLKRINTEEATKLFALAKIKEKTKINTKFEERYSRLLETDIREQSRLAYNSVINSKDAMISQYLDDAKIIQVNNNLPNSNPMLLKSFTSSEHRDLFKEAQLKTMLRANNNMKVKQRDGAEWRLETWYNREVRTMSKAMANDNTTAIMEAYDWDLVIIDTTDNCSPLCINAQGKIYSKFGKTKGYPLLSSVTTKSKYTWLFHPNCYHNENVYIPGFSEDLVKIKETKTEIKRNYEEEQAKRNVERNIRKYTERKKNMELAGELTGEDIKQTKEYIKNQEKLKEWKAKPHSKTRLINASKYTKNVV